MDSDADPPAPAEEATPTGPAAPPPPLGYAPAAARWRKRKIAAAVILAAGVIAAGLAYHHRARLGQLWREVRFALVLRRCLRYAQPPDRVAFDNDPRRAAELLREGRYVRIAHGGTAAGLDCPPMQDLTGGLGPFGLGWSPPTPGGTAFLHERRTASGRRLLAYVVGSVDARTGEPLLSVAAFDLRGWSTPPLFAGGMLYTASDLRTMAGLSWAPGEPLRLLAGQPDPNDPSRFSVEYESASGRGRIAVRLHEAEQQGLPARWVSVAVEQERSPATGRTHSAHPR